MGEVTAYDGRRYDYYDDIVKPRSFFDNLGTTTKNIGKGFLDENLIAIGAKKIIEAAIHDNPEHEVNNRYNIYRDPQFFGYEEIIPNFLHAKNSEHARQLFQEFKQNVKNGYGSPAYIAGRILGGFTDITSLFMFTKAGNVLLSGNKLAQISKFGGVLGAEELTKQVLHDNRTVREGMIITAAGFIVPAIFPTARVGGKKFDKYANMYDEADNIASDSAGAMRNPKTKKKFEEDYQAENQIQPTGLGVFGEKGPFNPVFRVLKNGTSNAQEFIEKVLELPLLQVKNFKNIATNPSIERSVKKRYQDVYIVERQIDTLYDEYTRSMGLEFKGKIEKHIKQTFNRGQNMLSKKEFRQQVFMYRMGYLDDANEFVKRASSVLDKNFYKKLGQEYIDLQIPLNWHKQYLKKVDAIIANLTSVVARRPNSTRAADNLAKFTGIRNKLQKRIKMYESGQGLKKNYINIVYRRDKINNDFANFAAIMEKELKFRYPNMSKTEIDELINNFKTYNPHIELQTWRTMVDDNVDDLTNFEKISSRFFARELDIDYRALIKAGFIEDDTQLLMRVYWNQVIPDIEITKVFGDPMGYGTQFGKGNYGMGIKQIYDDYTAAIKEVGENTKEGIALAKTRDKILDDLDVSIGLIRGTYGLAKDPNRSISRAIRMGKLYNSMTMLTGIAQVVDTARLVMINGIGKTFRLSWEVFTSGMSKEVFNMSKKSAQLGGEAFDMYNSSRAMSMYDVGDAFGVFNQFERGLSKVGNLYFTFLNLSNPWNAGAKSVAALFNGTRLLESAEAWGKGSISKVNKARMLNLGIDENMAARIYNQYKKHGVGKNGKKTHKDNGDDFTQLRVANSDEWTDDAAREAYHQAIGKQVNIDIVTPSKGDVPNWANTEIGGMIAQFKKFGMASTQRMLFRGLQERDFNQLQGALLLLGAGAAVDAFRQRAFNRDYSKKPFGQKIVDAFDRSGIGGVYSDVNNALERMGNNEIGLRPLLGAKKPYGTYRDLFNNPIPDVLGPTASQMANIADIMWTWGSGQYNHHTARNVRRLIPFQNVWFLDSAFDKVEKGLR